MVLSEIVCSTQVTGQLPVTYVRPQHITYLAFTMYAIKSPPLFQYKYGYSIPACGI